MRDRPDPIKKDDIKKNVLRVRASHNHVDTLTQRAAAMNMPVSTYMLWRSLKPLGQLKKSLDQNKEQKALVQSEVATYIAILRELNRQGINLNQITKAINSGKLKGKSIERCLQNIDEIRNINQQILESIADPGADL